MKIDTLVAEARAEYEKERQAELELLTSDQQPGKNYWQARWRAQKKLEIALQVQEALNESL